MYYILKSGVYRCNDLYIHWISRFSTLIRVSDDLYIHVLHQELKNAWGKNKNVFLIHYKISYLCILLLK